jgi:hypothetical protein
MEKELHVHIIAVTYRSYTTTKVGESLEQAIEVEEEEVKDEDEFPQKFQEEIENLLKDDTGYFPAPTRFRYSHRENPIRGNAGDILKPRNYPETYCRFGV